MLFLHLILVSCGTYCIKKFKFKAVFNCNYKYDKYWLFDKLLGKLIE